MSTPISVPTGSQVTKHPNAQKVYQILWNRFLEAGQTIGSSTWQISGPDNALTFDNATDDGASTTQLRLLGGTRGVIYTIENTITFGSGPVQTEVQSFTVYVSRD
jgi:hypothetical protein